jgi:hypothetical protein
MLLVKSLKFREKEAYSQKNKTIASLANICSVLQIFNNFSQVSSLSPTLLLDTSSPPPSLISLCLCPSNVQSLLFLGSQQRPKSGIHHGPGSV